MSLTGRCSRIRVKEDGPPELMSADPRRKATRIFLRDQIEA
jgi:hypothetical protein